MIACVHQPNFIPWLGFFAKIVRSDVYVVMDNVQFPKGSWTNRVQIAGTGNPLWLTVPVAHRGGLQTLITDMEIDYSFDWVRTQRRTLEARYGRCPHFKGIYPQLAGILESRYLRLAELNVAIIKWVFDLLSIETRLAIGSELPVAGKSSQLIVELCRAVGANDYLAGQGSADYEDLSAYTDGGIRYRRDTFSHPRYPQQGHTEFIQGLSVADAFFNIGVEGVKALLAQQVAANGSRN